MPNPLRILRGLVPVAVLAIGVHAEVGFTGRVLEKVACAADATQTYALYVPSSYTPEKKWPVIFCFDPGARGREPVVRFKAAAEKFGYIVAGSNNSRNGPWAANVAAVEAMVRDVRAHLAVDAERFYSAGLSGGARVATQLALAGLAKGVIACSAGFPVGGNVPGRVTFPFFGTAGTEDFNYPELKRLDGELEDRRAAHRIVIFEGGHEWASPALLSEGVEWIDLQAMRAGKRPRDDGSIQAALQRRLAGMEAKPAGAAWQEMKAIAADFKGLVDTSDYERKAKEMGAKREVKEWQKAERALMKREEGLTERLADLSMGGSLREIAKTAAEIRQMADAPMDSDERRMARRAIGGVAISARENVRALFEQESYAEAVSLLELLAALRPGQSRTYYDLARASAFNRDTKRALEALRQAAAAGLSDAPRLETEPAFAKLKKEAAFQETLAAIRANPPEPERNGGGRARF